MNKFNDTLHMTDVTMEINKEEVCFTISHIGKERCNLSFSKEKAYDILLKIDFMMRVYLPVKGNLRCTPAFTEAIRGAILTPVVSIEAFWVGTGIQLIFDNDIIVMVTEKNWKNNCMRILSVL